MAFAKGMTNREWIIHEQARCLHYLLSSVIKTVNDMRASFEVNISKLAEEESDGDPLIKHEREQYYLNLFNCSIPGDMERNFLQSMVIQIYSYIESILKDIAQDKSQDKSLSKIESYYNHIQKEKKKELGPISIYFSNWKRFHNMRNDISHDGYTSEKISEQDLECTIEQARLFLKAVENA